MKFTKRSIEALETTGKRYSVFDDDLKGFAVRIGVKGDKSFYYVYRAGKGRTAPLKWLRLGNFPSVTVEQARSLCREKMALVIQGNDPANTVKVNKQALTMEQGMQEFLSVHEVNIKPSTLKGYQCAVRNHILPRFGKLKIKDVTHSILTTSKKSMQDTPYQYNRMIALLSKFFNWCEHNDRRYIKKDSNPCNDIVKYPEKKRKEYLQTKDLEKLGKAFIILQEEGFTCPKTGKKSVIDNAILDAIKVLLFTGARLNEILTLQWSSIDFEKGHATITEHKTDGNDGDKTLQLPPPALLIIQKQPRINEYIFYGKGKRGHLINVQTTWRRLLMTAGLQGWRIHDLRHAFASYAASSGKSLPIVGAILGHTQAATTARYAHVQKNPIAEAATETANALQKDLSGGVLIPFNSKKTG